MNTQLASERIVVAAPLSYLGSAQRIKAWAKASNVHWTLTFLLIGLAWYGVTAWYVLWGLLLVPFRMIRRSGRNRKLAEVRHRELLEATQGTR